MQAWGCELPKPMGNSRVLCCTLATPKQKAEAGASPEPWAAWPSEFSKPQDSEKSCHNKHGGWFLRNNSWSCPLASTITRTHMSACVHTCACAHTHIYWQDFLSLMWRLMGKRELRKWLEVGACTTSASKKSAVKDACRQLDDLERRVSLKKWDGRPGNFLTMSVLVISSAVPASHVHQQKSVFSCNKVP